MLGWKQKSQLLSQVAHSGTTVLRLRSKISLVRTVLEFNILFGLVQSTPPMAMSQQVEQKPQVSSNLHI